jgi:serine/threonine protein kinase
MSKERILPQPTGFSQKSQDFTCRDFQTESFEFSARYRIIKDLGEGGIGKVFKAYDLWNRKEIALKVLATGKENPLLWESFKSEFLLLTQLRHPGVVEVFDFGYAEPPGWTKPTHGPVQADRRRGEVPYFTMEFVEGRTLHQNFDLVSFKDPSLPQSEKLYHFIWQICDILEYLHLRGIVHCDLKPDNIKVTDRIFSLKLLDFGLSEKMGARREKTAKGTLVYMAPEVFSDKLLDQRTDLYSLGVILYELVTSRLPFFSDDPVKIVSGHLEQPPAPPMSLNPEVDESLNELILNLLEKSPEKRPQSASRLKEITAGRLKRKPEIAERKTLLAHLYSGELVAREREEAQVGQLLKEIASSGGRVLLLAGEQGVGKSFFLRGVRIKCQLEDILYVDYNCLEDQTKAYQPLMEILRKIRPYLEERDPRLKDKFNQALGSILHKPDDKVFSPAQEQSSTHQEIMESLVCVSQIVPMVLVIDNLQWADFQTLRFLLQFGPKIEESRILLAGAFRPEETEEKTLLHELIDGWPEKAWCRHVKLDRFDYQKTGTFIRSKLKKGRFPEDFYRQLHQNTSGNPFFLTEVLKYLLEKKIIFLKDRGWEVGSEKSEEISAPHSIEAVLLKNLERYDEETCSFLNAVAVAGKRFDPELVSRLNLLGEKELSRAFFALTKDQVLIKKESPLKGRVYYEFANQSLQKLIYQRFDEKEKVRLHRRIAESLEERGSNEDEEAVFEIGDHYLRSHQHEKAYQYALLSAEKMAQRFANQEVVEYLGQAIETTSEFKDEQEGKRRKVEALMRRADFLKQIGELNPALRDYKAILGSPKGSTSLKILAEVYNDLGDTYRLKHDYKEGLASLQKALQIRQRLGDSLQIANTLHNMGIIYGIDSQYQKALVAYQRALSIYKRLGNKFYIASTLNGMGDLHRICHRHQQAMEFFQESLKIEKELGNKEEIARSLNNIGIVYVELGRYEMAIPNYQESLRLNEEIKNKKEIVYNLVNLGEVYQKAGDLSNALRYSQKAWGLAGDIDFTQAQGHIAKNLGVANFELGEYQRAYEYFKQAREISERIIDKELQIAVLLDFSKFCVILNADAKASSSLEEATRLINAIDDDRALAILYRLKSWLKNKKGEFRESAKLLKQASELMKDIDSQEDLFYLNLDFCEVFVGLKDHDKAKEYLKAASRFMREKSMSCGRASCLLSWEPRFYMNSGRVEWLGGDLSQAHRDFEIALQKAEESNRPELLWQIHHLLGKLSFSIHELEKAYNELQKAGRILKRVSENIEDDELKKNYLRDQEKEGLLSDLKEVAKDLMGESKMG